MSNSSCINVPDFNGKPSKLYLDLLHKYRLSRPLTNLVYAMYIAANNKVATAMDGVRNINGKSRYPREYLGEHRAADVIDFLHVKDWQNEKSKLSEEEKKAGFIDNNGKRIQFATGKEALDKADDFNNKHKGLVAIPIQHGNYFEVVAYEKNARNYYYPQEVQESLQVWDILKSELNGVGIDIENLPSSLQDVFNPVHTGLIDYLINLQNTPLKYIYKREAFALFSMNQNSAQVQKLLTVFNSLEDAAKAVDDINHGIKTTTTTNQRILLNAALQYSLSFNNLNLNDVKNKISNFKLASKLTDPNADVRDALHKLNAQCKINLTEITRTADKARTLSDVAADAIFTVEREIREIEKTQGTVQRGKDLERMRSKLMKELAYKRYYSGLLDFLNDALTQVQQIESELNNISTTGTEMEQAMSIAKTLKLVKESNDKYRQLSQALANETLTIDENIGQVEINNIRDLANKIESYFRKYDDKIDGLTREAMRKVLEQLMGNELPDGMTIENILDLEMADDSYMDFLYSMGRASNPLIAAMGTVMRDAQDTRNSQMTQISLEIRRATDKLYKAGPKNSRFMYTPDGHLLSDIDWQSYIKARNKAIKQLLKQNYTGFEFTEKLDEWEQNNTEERIVDKKTGRTERVPDKRYRNNLATWDYNKNEMVLDSSLYTAAQQEYYNTMMQLKGEIGTLLPEYARDHYLPPQIRRNTQETLEDAVRNRSWKEVGKAIKNRFENLWKVREDDTEFAKNGIVGEEKSIQTLSDYNNEILKQIPIFYVNPVAQDELLKDFSTGLQHLASTAINYNAINEVVDIVELMGDFIKDKINRDRKLKTDAIRDRDISVIKKLKARARNQNTENLVDGFIMQGLYGQKISPKDLEFFGEKGIKIIQNLIGYTSFKNLSTNVFGMTSNVLVGEAQMLIEAGAGEFYKVPDYLWAHTKLVGGAGLGGELAELLTNNINHKSVLFRNRFDPMQESFSDLSHKRYYGNAFQQLLSHDCSFIGYGAGEYIIHYINMYAILHNRKVLLNGKKISLYDAFEIGNKKDGNSELVLKQGVTLLDGSSVTEEYLDEVKNDIRSVNQNTHGSMNAEDKGLIHQRIVGRAAMNFRQWMVEHYSRRFRGRHYDFSTKSFREGYWTSVKKLLFNDDTKEAWKDNKLTAVGLFIKDFMTFMLRAQSQWTTLDDMQKYNVKRAHSEILTYLALLGFSMVLGEPEEHKKEFWRRWWIYQLKRLILDVEAGMPLPQNISNWLTIMQSPMAGLNTIDALLYMIYGLFNGDLIGEDSKIKSGPYKGQNKYLRNVKKHALPFFKDWYRLKNFATDDNIFKVFENTPGKF